MDASARLDRQHDQQEGRIDLDLLCPDCGYCLRTLPFEGRCPECGFAYVAEYPTEAKATRCFRQHIPAVLRCGISPQLAVRYPIVPLVAVLLVACAGVALLIAVFCLATRLGFMLATSGYPPRWNIVAEFGIFGTRGGFLRWHLYRIVPLAQGYFYVQLLVSLGVWRLYETRSGSCEPHGRIVRRLGLLAACSSAPAMLVPGLVVALWQIPNVIAPKWGNSRRFDFYWALRNPTWPTGDALQAVGIFLLVVATIWIARGILIRHTTCAIKLREIMRGVRAADTTKKTVN